MLLRFGPLGNEVVGRDRSDRSVDPRAVWCSSARHRGLMRRRVFVDRFCRCLSLGAFLGHVARSALCVFFLLACLLAGSLACLLGLLSPSRGLPARVRLFLVLTPSFCFLSWCALFRVWPCPSLCVHDVLWRIASACL